MSVSGQVLTLGIAVLFCVYPPPPPPCLVLSHGSLSECLPSLLMPVLDFHWKKWGQYCKDSSAPPDRCAGYVYAGKFLMLAETCLPFCRSPASVTTVRPVTIDNESTGRFRLYLKCLIFCQGLKIALVEEKENATAFLCLVC